jgi:hypothetical protein
MSPRSTAWLQAVLVCACSAQNRDPGPAPPSGKAAASPLPLDRPLDGCLVENVGQAGNDDVLFYGRTGALRFGLTSSGVLLETKRPRTKEPGRAAARAGGVRVSISFQGADGARPVGRGEFASRRHYLHGNDPRAWRTGVRSFEEVVYPDLYPGIDLHYRPVAQGVKYELLLEPRAELARVSLSVEGAEALELDPDGDLIVRTPAGDFRDVAPSGVQEGRAIPCAFVLLGPTSYGFSCQRFDRGKAFVIDPVYSTYIGPADDADGGTDRDEAWAVTVDPDGNLLVTGETESDDFPVTPGVLREEGDDREVFVAKLSANGRELVWATYLGGNDWEGGRSIALDARRYPHVTGYTLSPDFPTSPSAYDAVIAGVCVPDTWGFVAVLHESGSVLIYSTFVRSVCDLPGGNFLNEIALGPDGSVYVAGSTQSDEFPTTAGAFDETFNGGDQDAVVVRLQPDPTNDDPDPGTVVDEADLLYATYLGGDRDDQAWSLAVNRAGNAYVTGCTESNEVPHPDGDFPVTIDAVDTTSHDTIDDGDCDVFVTVLDEDGGDLLWSALFGGLADETGHSIALDGAAAVYVAGSTESDDFPFVAGSYDDTYNGAQDAFVVTLVPEGRELVYATALGGAGREHGRSVAVDGRGDAYVTGYTESADFPFAPGAYDPTHNGGRDVFLTRLNATGADLVYSSFLGGADDDEGAAVALDGDCFAYLGGWTSSDNFPTTFRALDRSYNDNRDAFLAKFDVLGCLGVRCPHGHGFWKNHPEAWPLAALDLGAASYGADDLMALLRAPTRGDASVILARQLIAAKLNVAAGVDPGPLATLGDPDALLAAFPGKLPYGVSPSTPAGAAMVSSAAALDGFNGGRLTPGCGP